MLASHPTVLLSRSLPSGRAAAVEEEGAGLPRVPAAHRLRGRRGPLLVEPHSPVLKPRLIFCLVWRDEGQVCLGPALALGSEQQHDPASGLMGRGREGPSGLPALAVLQDPVLQPQSATRSTRDISSLSGSLACGRGGAGLRGKDGNGSTHMKTHMHT